MSVNHAHTLVQSGSQLESQLFLSARNGMEWAENSEWTKDVHLFRAQDATAWIVFSVVFTVLIIFDNFVLHRSRKALTIGFAAMYTLFWVFTAFVFCGYIWWSRTSSSAANWMSGYMLEWMLSFDNLFVFHLIFQTYGTPDDLKHKPLFWGICGAVFFRLIFLFIGEWMMHTLFFAHILFGVFLIYTGVQTVIADDEDEDPSQNPVVQFLTRQVPFIGCYDSKGNFFVQVPLDAQGEPVLPPNQGNVRRSSMADEGEDVPEGGYGAVDFASLSNTPTAVRYQRRATLLFLVVVCLEVSDILFAVDSVSAIVAQVPDLFLAYTSAVFAMLGLRAMFFIVDELVKLFSLLKYGVGAVLVFIGLKLCASKFVHVPAGIVCLILFSTLGASMVASVLYERYKDNLERSIQQHTGEKKSSEPNEKTPLA